ncbi:hypothetical protein BGLA2_700074 [Burkholderia gladioli]|nr:hypothetical protein BGLA2_700074 [Burkholderia gladioli]
MHYFEPVNSTSPSCRAPIGLPVLCRSKFRFPDRCHAPSIHGVDAMRIEISRNPKQLLTNVRRKCPNLFPLGWNVRSRKVASQLTGQYSDINQLAGDKVSDRNLPQSLMGLPGYPNVLDIGKPHDHALYEGWIDVFTAAHDHAFEPSGKKEMAIALFEHVTGTQCPARPFEHRTRTSLIAQITVHDGRRIDQQFPTRSIAIILAQRQSDIRQRHAKRYSPVVEDPLGLQPPCRHPRTSLGQAVSGEDLRVLHRIEQARGEPGTHDIATDHQSLHFSKIIDWKIFQYAGRRAHACGGIECIQCTPNIDSLLIEQNAFCPNQQGCEQSGDQPVTVIQGQIQHHGIAGVQLHGSGMHRGITQQIGKRLNNDLRCTGGAAARNANRVRRMHFQRRIFGGRKQHVKLPESLARRGISKLQKHRFRRTGRNQKTTSDISDDFTHQVDWGGRLDENGKQTVLQSTEQHTNRRQADSHWNQHRHARFDVQFPEIPLPCPCRLDQRRKRYAASLARPDVVQAAMRIPLEMIEKSIQIHNIGHCELASS